MLVELLLVLVAAKCAAELSERLRAPAVLGEILAGVVVGPSVLGLVHSGETLHFLGELGVILLLLDVGLETDLGELRAVGRASMLVAVAGIALPFAGGTAGMLLLGQDGGAAIFVGAALTATSVGITARVFGDLRALATVEARTVLGAAVADDVLGLVILTVVVKLTTSGGVSPLDVGLVVAAASAFLLVATAASLAAAPRVFSVIDRASRSSGSMLVAALALTLGLAVLAETAGLAAIIGAFVAGVALAKTPRPERLRRDISPLASVLVPVFFLQIGIEADLGVFSDGRVLGVAAVLLVVAVAGKLLSAVGAVGARGDKALIGLGMLPRGEVGLIFAGIGLAEGVLGDDLYAALLIVVLGTTLVTPPLLRWRVGVVSRRSASSAADQPIAAMPEGGWLASIDGTVVLRGTPPAAIRPVLGLEAAVLVANGRPAPRLLQWFLDTATPAGAVPSPALAAELLAVIRTGNERSWRFLEAIGILEQVLPELAERIDQRRRDASELDPAALFSWSTIEGIRRLVGDAASDELMLAALVIDATGDAGDSPSRAAAVAERLGLDQASRAEIETLVGEHGRLSAASARPDALDEHTVTQLVTHLGSAQLVSDLYLLDLASFERETWERERLDQLHDRLQRALSEPDVAEARRSDALAQASSDRSRGRLLSASARWLLTQPAGALARQADLIDPLPPRRTVRVEVSGARIDVVGRDRSGLLAAAARVLAHHRIVVRFASTSTWPDGAVAMAFICTARCEVDPRALERDIAREIRRLPPPEPVPDAHVSFDHDSSPWHTILDAAAADRAGLLASLAGACTAVGASIHALVASTSDGVAVDRFELTDRRGEKLSVHACGAIRAVLSGAPGGSHATRKALTRTKQSGDSLETLRS